MFVTSMEVKSHSCNTLTGKPHRASAMMNKQLLKPNTFWLNETRYVSDAPMQATCTWKRSGEFVYDAYLSMIRLACVFNRFAFLVRYISSMCGLDSF